MKILTLDILVFVKLNGLSSEKLQKIQFLKSDWELIEREQYSIIQNPQSELLCATKCSANEECSGAVYDNLTGKYSILDLNPFLYKK